MVWDSKRRLAVALALFMWTCALSGLAAAHGPARFEAAKVAQAPVLDGRLDEPAWQEAKVYPIDQLWLGQLSGPGDCAGSFRVMWSEEENRIYVGVTMVDDVISDLTTDPLKDWWTDDGVEVFLDYDHSGGDHRYNHSAFAYHISLFGDAIDLDVTKKPINLKDHVQLGLSADRRTWEIAVKPIANYDHRNPQGAVVGKLTAGQTLGLLIAYNDNDGRRGVREAFLGAVPIAGPDKNLAWITADVFGDLYLMPGENSGEN